jgi:hypothetical protein
VTVGWHSRFVLSSLWRRQLDEQKFFRQFASLFRKKVEQKTISPSSAMKKTGHLKRRHLPTKIKRHIPDIRNAKIHASEKQKYFQLTLCF